MLVEAVWEFDADVSDLSADYVDILGCAKDFAKIEVESLLKEKLLSANDFVYRVKEKRNKVRELYKVTIDFNDGDYVQSFVFSNPRRVRRFVQLAADFIIPIDAENFEKDDYIFDEEIEPAEPIGIYVTASWEENRYPVSLCINTTRNTNMM